MAMKSQQVNETMEWRVYLVNETMEWRGSLQNETMEMEREAWELDHGYGERGLRTRPWIRGAP